MTQPRRPTPGATVVTLVPLARLREAGEPVVVRRPGRPRRVESVPTISEAAYHTAVAAEVHRAVEQDEVVVETLQDNPTQVLQKTMIAVASEAAALHWDRQKAQREGRAEAERISSRRVAALVRLADLVVVHEELRRADPEPKPEHVAAIVAMLMEELEATVNECAPAEVAERFIGALKEKLAASDFPYGTAPR